MMDGHRRHRPGLGLEFLHPFRLSIGDIIDSIEILFIGIKQHNTAVLNGLINGDLVQFKRRGYTHWAVYAGNENVIHLVSNRIGASRKVSVREENIWDIANSDIFYKNNSKDYTIRPSPAEEIIERARAKLGDIDYHVLWSNCEHFASYCRYGNPQSDQTEAAEVTGLTLLGAGIYYLVGKFRLAPG